MKKWEYYIIQHISSPSHQGIYGHDSNGERVKMSDNTGLQHACNALNKLGVDGWEVVGVTADGHQITWTLKR